ncbi:MAG TPA: hypothetical protein PLR83_04520 [Pyrinomonadaceae bacterium]|nr:hypothetical protein [Pyrinomonadaceae bacterium]
MKRLVLAIVAVCCAQLAYTAYNATEAGRQEFARVVTTPIAAPFYTRTTIAELDPTADVAVDLDPDEATENVDVEPVRRTIPRRKFRKNQVVTFDGNFETTSIVIPKGEKYEFKEPVAKESKVASFTAKKTNRTVVSAVEPEKRREKRSILDKTGSVIKKPFKWLKELFAKNDEH